MLIARHDKRQPLYMTAVRLWQLFELGRSQGRWIENLAAELGQELFEQLG